MSTPLRTPTRAKRDVEPEFAVNGARPSSRHDPRYQAFWLARVGFTVLPLVSGIDKYFNALVYWPGYLAHWIDNIVPGPAQQFMYGAGAVEILAGLLVAVRPRYGAYLLAAWLGGIVVNLLSSGGSWDIALRDFGLMIGALTLARLASVYDRGTRPTER